MVDKSEKVAWLARFGYATRGLVYILLGYLALSSRASDKVEDGTRGSLEFLQSIPGGTVILYACAVGLAGYAFYKFIVALFDTERYGTDAKGLGKRAIYFGSAVIYSGIAWTALKFAMGSKSSGGGAQQTHQITSQTLTFDFGSVVLGLVGIGVLIAAGVQAKNAVTAHFMKHISSAAPKATCWIGRGGLAARAVVFALMGWSLIRSAWVENSAEARSLGQAVLDLRDMGPAYTAVAIGLALFGVFSLVSARYRIIHDPDPGVHVDTSRLKALHS